MKERDEVYERQFVTSEVGGLPNRNQSKEKSCKIPLLGSSCHVLFCSDYEYCRDILPTPISIFFAHSCDFKTICLACLTFSLLAII